MGIPGKCFFCNSGAEANEGLIKLARKFGVQRPQADGSPRYEILTFTGSFHGRTMATMTATAQEKIHGGFGPLVPGFRYLPFNDVAALEAAISENTVAILLEPVQGESGVNPVTPEFLRAAARLRDQHDLLLLLDEVQCGLGQHGRHGRLAQHRARRRDPARCLELGEIHRQRLCAGVVLGAAAPDRNEPKRHDALRSSGGGESRHDLRRFAAGMRDGDGDIERHSARWTRGALEEDGGLHRGARPAPGSCRCCRKSAPSGS